MNAMYKPAARAAVPPPDVAMLSAARGRAAPPLHMSPLPPASGDRLRGRSVPAPVQFREPFMCSPPLTSRDARAPMGGDLQAVFSSRHASMPPRRAIKAEPKIHLPIPRVEPGAMFHFPKIEPVKLPPHSPPHLPAPRLVTRFTSDNSQDYRLHGLGGRGGAAAAPSDRAAAQRNLLSWDVARHQLAASRGLNGNFPSVVPNATTPQFQKLTMPHTTPNATLRERMNDAPVVIPEGAIIYRYNSRKELVPKEEVGEN